MQVTTCPATVHEPTDAVALVAVTPSERVSVTTTLTAVFGPALVTAIVDVMSAPAIAGSGVVVFVFDRSAFSATGVAVSLPTYVKVPADGLGDVAEACLVDERRAGGAPGPTVTRKRTDVVAPGRDRAAGARRTHRCRGGTRTVREAAMNSAWSSPAASVLAPALGPVDDASEPGT